GESRSVAVSRELRCEADWRRLIRRRGAAIHFRERTCLASGEGQFPMPLQPGVCLFDGEWLEFNWSRTPPGTGDRGVHAGEWIVRCDDPHHAQPLAVS